MPNTYAIGDVHGAHKALKQCLEKADFNYRDDTLICLGDVADGWPETMQAIDELMQIRNLIYILGNHDFWTLEWMQTGYADEVWLSQGGQATVDSYVDTHTENHEAFLRNARPYHLRNSELFVHAGIISGKKLETQGLNTFLWDRAFAKKAKEYHNAGVEKITEFDSVYIGHTPIDELEPKRYCEVWMMDTGAGWSGRLSMMNIDTHEFFVSDPVPELYPGIAGRRKY